MAINWRERMPLQQARATRLQLPRYLQLDGGRYLIGAALILAFLSLLSLGQTGRLATRGYELGQLEARKVELLRQSSRLQLELAEAESLVRIERRATEMGMRPMTPEQVRYVTISPDAAAPEAPTTPETSVETGEEAIEAAAPDETEQP